MERFETYRKAREKYSEIAQAMVTCEELGELASAVSKYYRSRVNFDSVLEEIADVMIVSEQLMMNIADRHDLDIEAVFEIVAQYKESKVDRLRKRVCDDKEGNKGCI